VLLGGAWDFLFLGRRRKELTTEDTESTEKRKTRIGRGDLETLGHKSPPFAKFAKGGAPKFTCDLMLDGEPKRADPSASLRASKLRPYNGWGGCGTIALW
jgi:hypothetical protein